MLVFEGIPLPPSSNKQYVSFLRRGRIIHAKAKELVAWRKEFDVWALQNATGVIFGREFVKDKKLCVHADIYWPKEKLYTKAGGVRKIDVANRMKALHDTLASLLLTDDSQFWTVSASKKEGPESVTVCISQVG